MIRKRRRTRKQRRKRRGTRKRSGTRKRRRRKRVLRGGERIRCPRCNGTGRIEVGGGGGGAILQSPKQERRFTRHHQGIMDGTQPTPPLPWKLQQDVARMAKEAKEDQLASQRTLLF